MEIIRLVKRLDEYDNLFYPIAKDHGTLSIGDYKREKNKMVIIKKSVMFNRWKKLTPITLYYNPKSGLLFHGDTMYGKPFVCTTVKGFLGITPETIKRDYPEIAKLFRSWYK